MGAVLMVVFGILLPIVALAIELFRGMSAGLFIDPIPTFMHALLVGYVPMANLMALLGSFRGWTRWRNVLLWSNGVALGIAVVYSLVYLPLTPIAIFAVLVGIGLLPLAPLCSLVVAIALRVRLVRMPAAESSGSAAGVAPAPPPSLASLLGGGVLGILLLVALEARIALTVTAANMAVSDAPGRVARGLNLLRRFGSHDELLQMCYRED